MARRKQQTETNKTRLTAKDAGPKRVRKQTAKAAQQDATSSGSEKGSDDEDNQKDEIDWNTDVALSEALITAITDDRKIKQALFPSPGSNVSSSKGGGKPKTEYHWILCQLLFTDHPSYGEAFKKVLDCGDGPKKATALRRLWGNKIKNRLVKMQKITKAHMDTMGQTGAGISHQDQIDMSLDNELTTKWAMIKQSCPWFFEMRELIAERPNIVPTGLGNSESGIDMDIFGGGNVNDDDAGSPVSRNDKGRSLSEDIDVDNGEDGGTEGMDSGDESVAAGKSKSHPPNNDGTKSAGKTSARPGTSKPVTRAPKENKKKRKIDEFVEIAGAEEVTRQKELDLAKARAEEKKAKMEAKTAEMEYKKQKLAEKVARRKEKAEEKTAKLRLFEFRQHMAPQPRHSHPSPNSTPTAFTPGNMSPYALNEPQFRANNNSPPAPSLNLTPAFTGPSTRYYRAGSVNFGADNSMDQPVDAFNNYKADASREGSLSFSNQDGSMRSESSPFEGSNPSLFESFQRGE